MNKPRLPLERQGWSKQQLGIGGHGALGDVWVKFRESGKAGPLSELERVQSR